jgi:hypothetical protein
MKEDKPPRQTARADSAAVRGRQVPDNLSKDEDEGQARPSERLVLRVIDWPSGP